MTDIELSRIEKHAKWQLEKFGPNAVSAQDARDALALVAEVRRLRGLVARVAQVDNDFGTLFCPWCGHSDEHSPRCEAFTPDGDVR